MEHSDELTFAEYFKSRYDLFRGLITFVVAMQWLIDHDFAEPTDRDARLMDIEVSRLDMTGSFFVPKTSQSAGGPELLAVQPFPQGKNIKLSPQFCC